jgi:hypothetical protein
MGEPVVGFQLIHYQTIELEGGVGIGGFGADVSPLREGLVTGSDLPGLTIAGTRRSLEKVDLRGAGSELFLGVEWQQFSRLGGLGRVDAVYLVRIVGESGVLHNRCDSWGTCGYSAYNHRDDDRAEILTDLGEHDYDLPL